MTEDDLSGRDVKELLNSYYKIYTQKGDANDREVRALREELNRRGVKLSTIGTLFDVFQSRRKSAKNSIENEEK